MKSQVRTGIDLKNEEAITLENAPGLRGAIAAGGINDKARAVGGDDAFVFIFFGGCQWEEKGVT